MPSTLQGLAEYREEIRKSRFHTIAAPVADEDEAQAFIAAHRDASAGHNCWAWKCGAQYRFSDDGEPGGSAGRPILAAIEGQDMDCVAVLVSRWFGGIKLGTGGLARAYGGGAAKCLQQRIRPADGEARSPGRHRLPGDPYSSALRYATSRAPSGCHATGVSQALANLRPGVLKPDEKPHSGMNSARRLWHHPRRFSPERRGGDV
ncbi:thymidylate synthase [Pseudomonas aeruginosa VRFPA09]|nr:thymidylate synthase [Pseudomonas aeruginosa VRFPA09]